MFLSFGPFNSPFGITSVNSIGPYLDGAFPDLSPNAGDWEIIPAFPNVTFIDPMAMEELPDQSGYLIAGKTGLIWWISNDPNSAEKITVLDITDIVMTGEDSGLVNMIFHPEFGNDNSPSKGFLYVMYAYHPSIENGNQPRMNRLSRFTYEADSKSIDPNSEFILIQDYDPQGYHQGGGMFFDNEGFLNFTVGDGGSSSSLDFTPYMQVIDKDLWGGLFRIDVDQDPNRSHPIRRQPIEFPGKPADLPETFTQGYFIPNANPWQDPDGGVLEEFVGLGLRSPHRATYDAVKEEIWIGDVGNGAREEVTILPIGGNAQWPFKEGNVAGNRNRPDELIGIETPPKFDYVRTKGVAVIGGFVYRGDMWSNILDGFYIYAEFSNGNIWSINPITDEEQILTNLVKDGVGGKSGISSFATNQAGEIFALNLYGKNLDGGSIYKLKLNQAPPEYIPVSLSETGAFNDIDDLVIRNGVIPYKTNSPLWSDGASKKRWVSIPNDGAFDTPDEQVVFSEQDHWKFPPGTVFIKHFELPVDENNPSVTKRLETRFFIIDKESNAYGITYKWNDAGTDAFLLDGELTESYAVQMADGSTKNQEWNYPNTLQCNSCHTPNAGFVLGVKTAQLNGDFEYDNAIANQLSTWDNLGIFSNSISDISLEDLPKAVALDDQSASDADRVFSYLDANCAHCHQPNGVNGVFDARLSTPLEHKSLVQNFGVSHNTPFGAKMIVPLMPEESQVWIRDNSIATDKMPPLSKNVIDEEYIEVLTRWINEIDESTIGPCTVKYLSDLDWTIEPENGWGPIELDLANGEDGEKDGSIMSIAGVPYSRGLGTHAYSEVSYKINCAYDYFSAFIGVDDGSCAKGSVIFEVWGDGKLIFESELMEYGQLAQYISLNIIGVNELKLIVQNADGISECDHGNWADAKLQKCQESGLTQITKAFAFGATEYTTKSANAPEVTYTKIVQDSMEMMYTTQKGYGYTDIAAIDDTPNDRNVVDEELYNQFIGTKGGTITFRVDIPNGDYRFVMVGGDPDNNKKVHTVKVRDGSSGFYSTLIDGANLVGPNFYKVGFNDTHIPDEENVNVFTYVNSPTLTVTKGYIEILQGAESGTGGDICFLEIWPEAAKLPLTPRGITYGEIPVEIMPNPFSTELGVLLHRPDPALSTAEIFIYDLSGRLMYSDMQVPFDMVKSIPIHNGWSTGNYFLQVRAGDYRGAQKLIKL